MVLRLQHGFTLVEMMVALAVGSIVTAGIYGTFVQQRQVYTLQGQTVDMQQNARLGMELMVGELRMAGFNPTSEATVGFRSGFVNFTGPHSIRFALDLTDDSCSGEPDGDSGDCNENVTYRLYDSGGDGDLDLGRRSRNDDDATIQPVIENVRSLDFCYFLVTAPNGPCVAAPTLEQLPDIRFVLIALTTQTATPDPHYDHPVNHDGYRTLTLTSVVKVRNLGL